MIKQLDMFEPRNVVKTIFKNGDDKSYHAIVWWDTWKQEPIKVLFASSCPSSDLYERDNTVDAFKEVMKAIDFWLSQYKELSKENMLACNKYLKVKLSNYEPITDTAEV